MYDKLERFDVFKGGKTFVGIAIAAFATAAGSLPELEAALGDASDAWVHFLQAAGFVIATAGRLLALARESATSIKK